MKSIKFCLILVVCIIFSCQSEQNNISVFRYSLQNDSIQKLKLNTNKIADLQIFKYQDSQDAIKSIDLKYNLNRDFLITDMDTFLVQENTYKSKSLEFKMYQTKKVTSHNRTLVFNENYGLLASLAVGADFIFLKDSLANKDRNIIFKEIFLNLNKVNID
ncbi:hypothetical protein [Polaribacter glomeratus]|uniref:Lipoprotein n=1 Tax=Polaribacter glomeratus TaxID=102 RepID=A0A2S7WXQ7_9FLAO|nr:hypothetical protein [Polaribacter glomeratus]PQJ82112.1 hypothetical protein BTO16_05785 [Polaribacter glomeratus]TXD66706.1 hypothetical protein ESX12_04100 [Polaribacter glomeratus]